MCYVVVFGVAGDRRMPAVGVNLYLNDEMIRITSFHHGGLDHLEVQVTWTASGCLVFQNCCILSRN